MNNIDTSTFVDITNRQLAEIFEGSLKAKHRIVKGYSASQIKAELQSLRSASMMPKYDAKLIH